jgi:hypothetical protein
LVYKGVSTLLPKKAAKHINVIINGGLMSGNMIFQTTNIQDSTAKIEEAVNIALVKAVRDFEIAA